MKAKETTDRWRRAEQILWGLVLFTLPVTSFRGYPNVFGQTQVKPLAFLPLAPFLLLAGIRIVRQRRWGWLGPLAPLGFFALVALTSTAYGWVLNPPPLFGLSYLHRAVRAWLSFAIGLGFLVGGLWAYERPADLRQALRWLYAGFVVTALWGTLQAAAIHLHVPSFDTLNRLQHGFSISDLQPKRISGMAYEPSWFADQLVVLYLPWLVAALLSGYRLLKWWWVEAGLVAWAGLLLVLTVSRSGVLVAFAAAAVVVGMSAIMWGRQRWSATWLRQAWPRLLGGAVVVGALLAVGLAILLHNNYFAVLFQLEPGQSLVDYIISIRSGSRLAYSWATMSLFGSHPWLGVGLGASGFSLYDLLPEWSRTMLPEIARHISPLYRVFLNPKNMYVRLLAETGLLGLLAFLAFVASIFGQSLAWWRRAGRPARFLAVASLWILTALSLRWFTQDSLATPNVWLSLGTLLALAAAPDADHMEA